MSEVFDAVPSFRKSPWLWRVPLAIALGVLVGLGGVLLLGDDEQEAPPSSAATITPSPEDTGVTEFPEDREEPPAEDEVFSKDMVVERVARDTDEGRTLSIYFVSPLIEKNSVVAVQACLDEFAKKKFSTVSCYGFRSDEAFEVAQVDPETGSMEQVCWSAFLSRAKGGPTQGRHSNPDYEEQGCPKDDQEAVAS